MLTDKKQRGPFKAWDLKTFFNDFCRQSLICELILALVSLSLLVNSIKKEKSQRENVRLIFLFHFTKRYFLIIILFILPLFGFQRVYDMTKRSDFILTKINICYNSNDRWKFILFFD